VLDGGERRELGAEAEELGRIGDLVAEDLDRLVALVGDVEDPVDAGVGGLLQDRPDLISRRELHIDCDGFGVRRHVSEKCRQGVRI
jgi:hypothetical protein